MNVIYSLLGWIALGFFVALIVRLFLDRSGKPSEDPPGPTYRVSADRRSITCLRCGLTSWHPEDVRQVYCGNCHRFHVR
jgi:hypothetical protein